MTSWAIALLRFATLLIALSAVVVGLWGAFGSPSDGWRDLGDVLIGPLLVGAVATTYLDLRSRRDPSASDRVPDGS